MTLFPHQMEAIKSWEVANYKGIISMATGTGKTYTAIGCVDLVFSKPDPAVCFISVPYKHLIKQWKESVDRYGLSYDLIVECHSENPSWERQLSRAFPKMATGQLSKILAISTHSSLVSEKMVEQIVRVPAGIKKLLVADEVHGMGSEKRRNNLPNVFDYVLGLSATPKRMYDEIGNAFLKSFFGEIVYEFPLCRAVYELNAATNRTFLTPYYYYPVKIFLNENESKKYLRLTKQINNLIRENGIDMSSATVEDLEALNIRGLERLLFKRSEIIKTASEKLEKLPEILNRIKKTQGSLKDTIIFTHEKLIDGITKILENFHVTYKKFTQELCLKEREETLDAFKKGHLDVLVAIKILDEGVDVPTAKNAVILSSTTNPREYIQRLGRVLRTTEGKTSAHVYDFVVLSSFNNSAKFTELRELEEKFLRSEILRVKLIAECSLNGIDAISDVFS